MKRIGIYPGTFDPVHLGHITFALKAKELYKLDQIVFLPETNPRGKQDVSSLIDRLGWLDESFVNHPDFVYYLPKASPFTVTDTLPELIQAFPETRFSLLVGSDVFRSLPTWPLIQELLQSTQIIVGLRQFDQKNDVQKIIDELKTNYGAALPIEVTALPATSHLSSSLYK